ncbi:predicted protein, partial [Nematostella vectensis]
KADLAVSTFTISPEREKAVDFTQPYFSLGYKIVMKKAIKEKKSNLSSSIKVITAMVWFAISIFGATYTANLAAFLTVNKYEHPIKSIEDLADQQGIAYG